MGRKKYNNFPRGLSLEADVEKRNPKVLKVYRVMEQEDSDKIAGVVRDISRDDDEFPLLARIHTRHTAYILDPRIVRREFKTGFEAGYNFRGTVDNVEESIEDSSDLAEAKVGTIIFPGNTRRLIAAYLESEQLRKERKAIYRELGKSGLKGFRRAEHKNPPMPLVVLAQAKAPISSDQMSMVKDVIGDALAIHGAERVTFGPILFSEE